MTHLSLLDVAAIVAWSTAAVALLGALALRLTPDSEPVDQPRLFIPTADLGPDSLLRIAPILVAAETRHWATGPLPKHLGPDTPRNYRPASARVLASYATTTTEINR